MTEQGHLAWMGARGCMAKCGYWNWTWSEKERRLQLLDGQRQNQEIVHRKGQLGY